LLQNVEILTGDFEQTASKITEETFFYLDPPYRPLTSTSNFCDYSKESFNDASQIRLKEFCDKLDSMGVTFMLSNSDGMQCNVQDAFFDELYTDYQINRVLASRSINSDASKRGKLTEIVVGNQLGQQYSLFSAIR
jgi:DNA adenine methylase